MGIVDEAKENYLAMTAARKQDFERIREETIRANASLLSINREIFRICADQMSGNISDERAGMLMADAEERFGKEAERLGVRDLVGEYIPLCGECDDTGYVNGSQCRCLTRHIIEQCYGEGYSAEYRSMPEVSGFDTGIYAREESRRLAEKGKRSMMKYIMDFDSSPSNLAIIGVPGSGKTLMARIICGELMKKGYTVMCLAAYRIVEIFSEEMFSDESDGIRDLAESCDLLVIDDLGTERQTNFTENLLFELIDTRFRRDLPTIITTNLSPEKQREYYGDRIFSRIYSRCNAVINTPGEDIRLKVNILK